MADAESESRGAEEVSEVTIATLVALLEEAGANGDGIERPSRLQERRGDTDPFSATNASLSRTSPIERQVNVEPVCPRVALCFNAGESAMEDCIRHRMQSPTKQSSCALRLITGSRALTRCASRC